MPRALNRKPTARMPATTTARKMSSRGIRATRRRMTNSGRLIATVAISRPEFDILRRVARPPLLAIFLGVVVAGILAVGFLFNALGM